MKTTLAVSILFALGLAVVRADQWQVTNIITLSFTAKGQSAISDNGTNSTAPAPFTKSVTTANVLKALAIAENALGNYPTNTFPAGTKLAVVTGKHPHCVVLDTHNTPILDPVDFIYFDNGVFGVNIFSGNRNDVTGLGNKTYTHLETGSFAYVDTWLLGTNGVKFVLVGTMNNTITDKFAANGTNYTETQSHVIKTAVGEGIWQGTPFVSGGSFSANGSGAFTLVP